MSLYLTRCKNQKQILKDYDKNTELSYLQYLDENNLCGWAMSSSK